MKKQPFVLVFLLLLYSQLLMSQTRDPREVKEKSSSAFSKKSNKKLLMPYEPAQTVPVSNRANSDFSSKINIYAVVVGVGNYVAMPKLEYTDDDAQMFYDHLKSKGGGAIPASNIRLLINGNATRNNVLAALKQMSSKADANDVFIFYFSGHGLSGSFLPVDFDGYSQLIRHDEIMRILDRSAAKQKLCIADACFSGAISGSTSFNARGEYAAATDCYYDAFASAANGTALLMSSNPGEMSLEDRRLRHGVFTYFLMLGLKGAADTNHNRIVTIQELFQYVYYTVGRYTEGVQSPVLSGDYDNKMPVSMTFSMN